MCLYCVAFLEHYQLALSLSNEQRSLNKNSEVVKTQQLLGIVSMSLIVVLEPDYTVFDRKGSVSLGTAIVKQHSSVGCFRPLVVDPLE